MPDGRFRGAEGLVQIVEDDPDLSAALVRLIRSVNLEARAHASAGAFLKTRHGDGPGCILLDINLPDISGLDFQDEMENRGIRQPVIVMTGYGDIPTSVRAMKAGAVDFLTKPFRDQDLLDAVAQALARDKRRLVAEEARDAACHRFASLSPREREVFAGVIEGLRNKEIAARLNLSIVTVKAHRGSLMRKLGARSAADLVRAAQSMDSAAA